MTQYATQPFTPYGEGEEAPWLTDGNGNRYQEKYKPYVVNLFTEKDYPEYKMAEQIRLESEARLRANQIAHDKMIAEYNARNQAQIDSAIATAKADYQAAVGQRNQAVKNYESQSQNSQQESNSGQVGVGNNGFASGSKKGYQFATTDGLVNIKSAWNDNAARWEYDGLKKSFMKESKKSDGSVFYEPKYSTFYALRKMTDAVINNHNLDNKPISKEAAQKEATDLLKMAGVTTIDQLENGTSNVAEGLNTLGSSAMSAITSLASGASGLGQLAGKAFGEEYQEAEWIGKLDEYNNKDFSSKRLRNERAAFSEIAADEDMSAQDMIEFLVSDGKQLSAQMLGSSLLQFGGIGKATSALGKLAKGLKFFKKGDDIAALAKGIKKSDLVSLLSGIAPTAPATVMGLVTTGNQLNKYNKDGKLTTPEIISSFGSGVVEAGLSGIIGGGERQVANAIAGRAIVAPEATLLKKVPQAIKESFEEGLTSGAQNLADQVIDKDGNFDPTDISANRLLKDAASGALLGAASGVGMPIIAKGLNARNERALNKKNKANESQNGINLNEPEQIQSQSDEFEVNIPYEGYAPKKVYDESRNSLRESIQELRNLSDNDISYDENLSVKENLELVNSKLSEYEPSSTSEKKVIARIDSIKNKIESSERAIDYEFGKEYEIPSDALPLLREELKANLGNDYEDDIKIDYNKLIAKSNADDESAKSIISKFNEISELRKLSVDEFLKENNLDKEELASIRYLLNEVNKSNVGDEIKLDKNTTNEINRIVLNANEKIKNAAYNGYEDNQFNEVLKKSNEFLEAINRKRKKDIQENNDKILYDESDLEVLANDNDMSIPQLKENIRSLNKAIKSAPNKFDDLPIILAKDNNELYQAYQKVFSRLNEPEYRNLLANVKPFLEGKKQDRDAAKATEAERLAAEAKEKLELEEQAKKEAKSNKLISGLTLNVKESVVEELAASYFGEKEARNAIKGLDKIKKDSPRRFPEIDINSAQDFFSTLALYQRIDSETLGKPRTELFNSLYPKKDAIELIKEKQELEAQAAKAKQDRDAAKATEAERLAAETYEGKLKSLEEKVQKKEMDAKKAEEVLKNSKRGGGRVGLNKANDALEKAIKELTDFKNTGVKNGLLTKSNQPINNSVKKKSEQKIDNKYKLLSKYQTGIPLSETSSKQEIIDSLSKSIKGFDANLLNGNVIVEQSLNDLPDDILNIIEGETPSGFYYKNKVYLIADFIKSGDENAVYLHELSHANLKSILDEKYDNSISYLREIGEKGDNIVREAIARVKAADTNENDVNEELIAYTIQVQQEFKNKSSFVRNVIDDMLSSVKSFARRFGIDFNYTPNDLVFLLKQNNEIKYDEKGNEIYFSKPVSSNEIEMLYGYNKLDQTERLGSAQKMPNGKWLVSINTDSLSVQKEVNGIDAAKRELYDAKLLVRGRLKSPMLEAAAIRTQEAAKNPALASSKVWNNLVKNMPDASKPALDKLANVINRFIVHNVRSGEGLYAMNREIDRVQGLREGATTQRFKAIGREMDGKIGAKGIDAPSYYDVNARTLDLVKQSGLKYEEIQRGVLAIYASRQEGAELNDKLSKGLGRDANGDRLEQLYGFKTDGEFDPKAERYLASISDSQKQALTAIYNNISRANEIVANEQVSAGLITRKEYERRKAMGFEFLTLKSDEHNIASKESRNGRTTEPKHAVSRTLELQTVLLRQVAKAKQWQFIVEQYRKAPVSDFMELNLQMAEAGSGGKAWRNGDAVNDDSGRNKVGLKVPMPDGSIVEITSKTKWLNEAILKDYKEDSGFSKLVVAAQTAFGVAHTSANLTYLSTAPVIDSVSVLFNTGHAFGKGVVKSGDETALGAKIIASAIGYVGTYAKKGAIGSSHKDAYAKLYDALGGGTGIHGGFGFEHAKKAIDSHTSKNMVGAFGGKSVSAAKKAMDTLHSLDVAYRVAAFKHGIEYVSQRKFNDAAELKRYLDENKVVRDIALEGSRSITIDYSESGKGRIAKAWLPFFNATMQGAFTLLPRTMATEQGLKMAGLLFGATVISAISAMDGDDDIDDDGGSKFLRSANVGAYVSVGGVNIWIPHELRPITTGAIYAVAIAKDKASVTDAAMKTSKAVMAGMTPYSGAGGGGFANEAMYFASGVAQPIVPFITGKNFFGKKLDDQYVAGVRYGQDGMQHEISDYKTSAALKNIAEFMYSEFGVDVSPLKMQESVNIFSGGLGKTISSAIDLDGEAILDQITSRYEYKENDYYVKQLFNEYQNEIEEMIRSKEREKNGQYQFGRRIDNVKANEILPILTDARKRARKLSINGLDQKSAYAILNDSSSEASRKDDAEKALKAIQLMSNKIYGEALIKAKSLE